MAEGFDIDRRDIPNDNRQDLRGGVGGDAKADYGGDLAKDAGVDLNAGADTGSGTVETGHDADTAGEDLNDSGMDAVLDNFQQDRWSDLSLDEQKQSITDLADFVAADTGNENPPEIVFRDDMPDGSYGGYSPDTNTIEINVNMLDDNVEAADTIAHEMWHAHQEQTAKDPNNPRAVEYQEGFDNYISPEYDFEGYENQMVEAEAREYAQGFKDRLTNMKGAA
jgi:hypothetical protein